MNPSGHLNRCLAIAQALATAGADPVVFTEAQWASDVRAAGAHHVDLMAGRPLDGVDATSTPRSCRNVTFAGCYAEQVAEEVRAHRPRLIITDSFSVIGRVVAHHLGLPWVNVAAGHNALPTSLPRLIASSAEVRVSDACRDAVEVLRTRFGIKDASPFSWVSPPSPNLNLCGQPAEFLSDAEQRALSPVAFLGLVRPRRARTSHRDGFPPGPGPRVYVSFGTVVWRYWPRECLNAMHAIAEGIEASSGARAVISLGGHQLPESDVRRLERPSVRVRTAVDQWALLQDTDAFITHHGMNSTHEAVYHRVPMLSYPFWWDQPELALRCQELGIALPLVDAPRAPLSARAVQTSLATLHARRAAMSPCLAELSAAERATVARRPELVERILILAGANPP